MARRPKILRRQDHSGLYVLGACVVVVGLLLFGLSMLGSSPQQTAEVEETPDRTTAETTKPVKEETKAEKTTGEKPEKKAEKTTEEKPKVEEVEPPADATLADVSAPASSELYLTVPKMGLAGDYVANGVDEGTLYNGAGHAPTTGFPWQPGSNTYIASHVLGYEGTGSYMHFAALPNMVNGDQIFITDASGNEYTYTVFEVLQVSIYDLWVMDPTGEDIVSLQTCINPPAYDVRLVVRGKLTDVKPA